MSFKFDGLDKFVALSKENTEAVVKSGSAAVKGLEDLAKASQAYFTASVEKNDAAVKALLAVKSPQELVDLQTKLARDAVEVAVAEGRKFAELSQQVVTAAIEPLNARLASVQSLFKLAA